MIHAATLSFDKKFFENFFRMITHTAVSFSNIRLLVFREHFEF